MIQRIIIATGLKDRMDSTLGVDRERLPRHLVGLREEEEEERQVARRKMLSHKMEEEAHPVHRKVQKHPWRD